MEIVGHRIEVWARKAVHATTIRTNYLPAEIIAMREDGTSESTNPEAHSARIRANKNYESLKIEHKRKEETIKHLFLDSMDAISRLSAEVLEAQEARDRFKRERDEAQRQVAYLTASAPVTLTPGPHTWVTHADYVKVREGRDAAYGDIQTLTTERDQLKRELGEMHSAIAEPAAREAVQRVLHGVRPDLYESPGPIGGTIRPDDVVTFRADWNIPEHNGKPFNTMVENGELVKILRADRDKIADRLAKCREEKRLQNAQIWAFYDEVQRLKTTYSMDRVHGMTLEEVRGLKAERNEIAAKLAAVTSALAG